MAVQAEARDSNAIRTVLKAIREGEWLRLQGSEIFDFTAACTVIQLLAERIEEDVKRQKTQSAFSNVKVTPIEETEPDKPAAKKAPAKKATKK